MQLSPQLTEKIHKEGKARAVFALVVGICLGLSIAALFMDNVEGFIVGMCGAILSLVGWGLCYRSLDRLMQHALYEQKVKYRYPANLLDLSTVMIGESTRAGLTMAVRALPANVCRTTALIILSPEANANIREYLPGQGIMRGEAAELTSRDLVFYGIPMVIDDLCPVHALLVPEYTGVWLPAEGCIVVAEPLASLNARLDAKENA